MLSAIPVFGNTFSPALATGAFGASGFVFSEGFSGLAGVSGWGLFPFSPCGCSGVVGPAGVDGSTCLGVTVTGTSTSTISPDGSFTLTLTLGFCPAVSVVGISPTSTISAPYSYWSW